ncbi:MAG: hydroxysqualene dehydroxylase HpnE [Acidobacteriaceae bacterium]
MVSGDGVTGARQDVVVIGAGVAGLAAAAALAGDGARVTLLERRGFVGGRAYSYEQPALGETIDSQHVVLGCCTNIVELMAQAGAAESLRWYDELCFMEPQSSGEPRLSWMRPGGLPAPMHQAMSFLRAPMLGLRDKAAIAAGLMRFLRGAPASDAESFAEWLKRTSQTERAIRHFWQPVVVGALNDSFERCSVKYAGKVFYESFLRSAGGGRLGIPPRPLSEFFAPVAELAARLGAEIRLNASVDALERSADGRWRLRIGSEEREADAVVLACDLRGAQRLLAGVPEAAERIDFSTFVVAPITTVHLWYDREVVDLDHAVLLDTRIEWMFAKSRIRGWPKDRGSYLELVISASWPELGMGREAILQAALRELELFFPRVREAKLVKSAVLKEARATFSVGPGMDAVRPPQRLGTPGLFLAGDWTATGWPSTMEGAVRSGRMAAGEVAGEPRRFLAAELAPRGLMRWVSNASAR